jgi:hypothetical protein
MLGLFEFRFCSGKLVFSALDKSGVWIERLRGIEMPAEDGRAGTPLAD